MTMMAQAQVVTIATNPQGSFYYSVGAAVAGLLQQKGGMAARVQPRPQRRADVADVRVARRARRVAQARAAHGSASQRVASRWRTRNVATAAAKSAGTGASNSRHSSVAGRRKPSRHACSAWRGISVDARP